MKDGLLIISSIRQRQLFLSDVLSSLKQTHRRFFLRAKSKKLLARARHEHWQAANMRLPVWPYALFFIALPIVWLWFGLPFIVRLWRWNPQSILLVNWPEKIIYTPLAALLGRRLYWLHYPNSTQIDFPPLSALFRHFAKRAVVITFCQSDAEAIKQYVSPEHVKIIQPGSNLKIEQQDTLFKNLANSGSERGRFVIGTVLYGLPKEPAERLLSALSIAQAICPVIELVIIGEGKNRKHIQWTIKRLGLEKKVWLAGSAADFPRWAAHLDVYAIASTHPTLDDLDYALAALTSGLPIIGPDVDWLRDSIGPASCLLNIADPEAIAGQLISLQQTEERRTKLRREAKRLAHNLVFEKSLNDFIQLLYNGS